MNTLIRMALLLMLLGIIQLVATSLMGQMGPITESIRKGVTR